MSENRVVESCYIGPPIDEQLIQELRDQVKFGATVPRIVDMIQARIPYAHEGCMWNILYFIKAFNIGIGEAKGLGAWNRFTDNGYTDEEINAKLMPLIIKNQSIWDEDFHNDRP